VQAAVQPVGCEHQSQKTHDASRVGLRTRLSSLSSTMCRGRDERKWCRGMCVVQRCVGE
jgi:hypothetical protein